ncbi:MAG: Gfo/Idh/MocA family protein [Lachnospiraceae bacterium]
MNVGMLGTGTIATRLSDTFAKMSGNVVTYAIASNPKACTLFVEHYGWKKWYPTYEEVMADPEVDIIYIAVPNPLHYELCIKALNYGKHVICEKPFCINEKQAKEVFALAAEKKLFITEAVWTNYMPSRELIDAELASGQIGTLLEVEIRLESYILFKERIKSLELAGGALLDLGPYTLGVMLSHFGYDIRTIKPDIAFLDTGVDGRDDILFEYGNGFKVRIINNCAASYDVRVCEIRGTEGKIVIEGTTNPRKITVLNRLAEVVKEVAVPEQISGYEYEFLACERCINNHELECPEMPHKQTLYALHLMDVIRNIAGIRYPGE